MSDPTSESATVAAANGSALRRVRDSDERGQEWEFSCECGGQDCRESVFLSIDAFVALHDAGGTLLAKGHQLSQVERARRLRAEAEALRGQAGHQVKRAKKNLQGRRLWAAE